MKAFLCVLPLVLMIFGCAQPPAPEPIADKAPLPDSELRAFSASEKATLTKFMAASLKDPKSAEFRFTGFPRAVKTGTVPYCATVNAKNSYGGYSGFTPFIGGISLVDGRIVAAAISVIEDQGSTFVVSQCLKEGLDPFRAY